LTRKTLYLLFSECAESIESGAGIEGAKTRATRHRGARGFGWMFRFALAAYNLVRMRNLLPAAA
jgi:hypothetical protein